MKKLLDLIMKRLSFKDSDDFFEEELEDCSRVSIKKGVVEKVHGFDLFFVEIFS